MQYQVFVLYQLLISLVLVHYLKCVTCFDFVLQAIMEWYFAKPNWRIESIGYSGIQYQVPLKVVFFTERGQNTMSVFNFNPVVFATEPRVFDIKPCFTLEEQRLVRFSLNGKNFHLLYSTNLSSMMVYFSKTV